MPRYVAKVVGFAVVSCTRCKGSGRKGWKDQETGEVIPCDCVEFRDMDTVVQQEKDGEVETAPKSKRPS